MGTVSFDKEAFGIPGEAQLYLFAENHISVSFLCDQEAEAFIECIEALMESESAKLKMFSVFLKVFFEGGFAYNAKLTKDNDRGTFLPKNVGIACMSTVKAFE